LEHLIWFFGLFVSDQVLKVNRRFPENNCGHGVLFLFVGEYTGPVSFSLSFSAGPGYPTIKE
jgi:hypothetical protein